MEKEIVVLIKTGWEPDIVKYLAIINPYRNFTVKVVITEMK